jgi:hypothetical protein
VRLSGLTRLFVGTPLPTAQSRHERLDKIAALAVFASDALSSAADATEETLLALVLAASVMLGPRLECIDHLRTQGENHVVTIVWPECIPARWWQLGLHNQTAVLINGAMLFRRNVSVTDVPSLLRHRRGRRPDAAPAPIARRLRARCGGPARPPRPPRPARRPGPPRESPLAAATAGR